MGYKDCGEAGCSEKCCGNAQRLRMIQVTVTGQLALLMLIERMELAGIPVMSANTDSIVMREPQPFDEARERQEFEERAYDHYLKTRTKRALENGAKVFLDTIEPAPREQVFQRGEAGDYTLIAFQAAWVGWKMARGAA